MHVPYQTFMAITIATMLVQALVRAGVKRIHGLTGDSLNSIVDEVRQTDGIEWLSYRHEEAAAFAASAEAQLTGQLAVCAGSCGPGNLHLINGLYDAHRSHAPVLAIAAHIPSGEIGTGYFQETHPERLFQECSHYCEVISSARQMPRVLQQAMQHAISREGVAVIALSGDVAVEKVEDDYLVHDVSLPSPRLLPNEGELQRLSALINENQRITILAGSGCAHARDQVLALCERLQAPLVYALRGKEWLEADNPYAVGLTGLIGFASAHQAIQAAEVLLMLGTDFPYKDWLPRDAKIVQIDKRAEHLGRRSHLEMGLVGHIDQTLDALLPLIDAKTEASHLIQYRNDYLKLQEKLISDEDGKGYIHPPSIAYHLSQLAPANTIFTCDVGTPTVWAARNLQLKQGQRLLGSFSHGSMASAMVHAIGAQHAYPERPVIALCGDGGFAMLMGELLTIRQYKLPIKLVIFNNASLGFVAIEMKTAGLPPFGIHLDNPDFARLAASMGIKGIRLEKRENIGLALEEMLAHEGPVLLDVIVNPEELSMPPEIKLEQAYGFSMYMIKETLRGNGKKVVNTIVSNFIE